MYYRVIFLKLKTVYRWEGKSRMKRGSDGNCCVVNPLLT